MDRKESLVGQRLAKLESLRRRGIDPYPHRYHRTHTTQEAVALFKQQQNAGSQSQATVSLGGRLVGSRHMGKATFLDIRDGTGKIQLHLRRDLLGEAKYGEVKELDVGDIIGVRGRLFCTKTGEVTLEVEDFVVLCKALQPLPEKWHGLTDVEKRYRQRYLDLISSEEVRSIFAVRSRAIAAMRRFLEGRGFVEVETPVLQPVASGAMARPFITHHQALDQDLYLRIATELHLKRLVIGGYDKVYELGRIFRNEGISTRHNPEFTTLESYEAYADYNDVMEMAEQMVSTIAQEVLGRQKLTYAGQEIDLSPPWRRITLRQAIEESCGIDIEKDQDEEALKARLASALSGHTEIAAVKGWGKLVDKLLSTFVEPTLIQPTFVKDYPVELSPLAKRKPGSEHLVERFEAFIGGMEIANAFTELNDPVEQRQRFAQQEALRQTLGDEEAERLDEDFVLALEYGMPPTGGLGVGVDRLVMLFTDEQSIREVILFPQLRTK